MMDSVFVQMFVEQVEKVTVTMQVVAIVLVLLPGMGFVGVLLQLRQMTIDVRESLRKRD